MRIVVVDDSVLLREGIVYEFLKSDAVMVDPRCTDLRRLTGANYIVGWDTADDVHTWMAIG